MSTDTAAESTDIISKVQKCHTVRINTGNIQRHPELFRRIFKNSVEELLATLAFQLDGPNGPDLELKADNTVMLIRDAENCRLNIIERADMKITLKVFISSLDIRQIEESVDAALQEIHVKTISQLIIAFPLNDNLNIDPSVPSEVELWLSRILPFWRQLESLISSHKVHSLGVADLDYEQLKALYESTTNIRPMIVHYNIENCCTVPPELRDYAKANDIQLLTHNDPHLCNISERLHIVVSKLFGNEKFELDWCARFTIWLRSRSVIGAKGYILQFHKKIP